MPAKPIDDSVPRNDTASQTTKKPAPRPSRSFHPGRSLFSNTAVVIDTREQRPFEFPPEIKTTVATLATGDYSVAGWTPFISIERKSWDDLYSCFGTERTRFKEELERLSIMRYPAVVIEAPFGKLWKQYYHAVRRGSKLPTKSFMSPLVAQKAIISWSWRYKIPFYFCETREQAMRWTLLLLDDAVRVLVREDKARDKGSM